MEQQLRFTTAPDGVNICYATVGEGPPLVKAANWMSHLEYDWRTPVWSHWWEELSRDNLLVRFDQRGCGLSDWTVEDLSFDAHVSDLEAVVDAAGLERFALLGISQGGAAAIEYSVRHPERVSHLILYGAFALGGFLRGDADKEEREAMQTLMKVGWGRDDPAYRQLFTNLFMPGATSEQMDWFNELQRVSASAENAFKLSVANSTIDVSHRLTQVQAPTLVLHAREDRRIPFDAGRKLAATIPGAKFVPLEGRNHILLENEPAWAVFLSEVRRFLGTESAPATVPAQPAAAAAPVGASVEKDAQEAQRLIAGLENVALSRFSVVPGYSKYDEGVRNSLKDARQKIAQGLANPSRARENHLLWAAPGSGKTFFVQRTGASVVGDFRYQEINLAGCDESEFLTHLRDIEQHQGACLCFVDEIDAKPEEVWPYELLLPYLDAATERESSLVFVMAGSSGSSIDEMKQRIAARPKGEDLLSRIPGANEHQIPAMGIGDRVLVALTQFRQAGAESGKDVRSVEKLGLYYVAVTPRLDNARQLREFAVRAVERMPAGEDRVRYDHLFEPGDPQNKDFWIAATAAVGDLSNRYVAVED